MTDKNVIKITIIDIGNRETDNIISSMLVNDKSISHRKVEMPLFYTFECSFSKKHFLV